MKAKQNKNSSLKNGIQDQDLSKKGIAVEDQIIRLFDEVLESDEKIIKGFKPNKIKLIFSKFLLIGLPCLFIAFFGLLTYFIPDNQTSYTASLVIMIVAFSLSLLLFAMGMCFVVLYYRNTYYVYTNKRLIIRTGIIGIDFKRLDLNNVSEGEVYTSFIDKMLRKNTGTIKFKSNYAQMSSINGNYIFAHIEKPYDVYKEIKTLINEVQSNQKK